jgi:radical SAM superfamily enzyme YgiQ (UPF0313 family)
MTFDIIIFTDLTGQFYHNKPAGAYSLASTLRREGFSVLVVDHFQRYLRKPQLMFEVIHKYIGDNTLFVGFSSTFFTQNLPDDKDFTNWLEFDSGNTVPAFPDEFTSRLLIKQIKKINPKTKIVYGGMNSNKPEVLESDFGIDYVVHGYAEISALALANHLKFGHLLKTKQSGNVTVLDYAAFDAEFDFKHHLTRYEDHDILQHGETLVVETSRGCMYDCTFCNFPLRGRKRDDFSYHTHEDLLYEYFMRNYELAGITNYMLSDSTFNETTEKLIRFRDVVKRTGLDLKFTCWIRTDLLHKHPEQLEILIDSGITSVWLGLESLHQPSVSAITKKCNVEDIKQTILNIRKVGGEDFKIYASFIVGLPHDTPKTIATWMDWVINESPIDCVQIEALAIGDSRTPWPANFSTNLESYGYTRVESEYNDKYKYFDVVNWYNKVWTFIEARELALKYQQQLWTTGRNRLASFPLFGMFSYGYKFDDIKNLSINNLPYADIIKRGQDLFDDYHNRLINL